ncbi:MAG: zinc-ribbon domain-containing protein [Saprospiraceae bacterium]
MSCACKNCGAELVSNVNQCPNCNFPVQINYEFCQSEERKVFDCTNCGEEGIDENKCTSCGFETRKKEERIRLLPYSIIQPGLTGA